MDKDDIQLPWGIEQKDIQPGSMKQLNKTKLQRFTIGQQKKTKFQRDIELRLAKKKQQDEDAAKVYTQFAASFEASSSSSLSSSRPKTRKGNKMSEMDKMLREMTASKASRDTGSSSRTKHQQQHQNRIQIRMPTAEQQRQVIDRLAKFVAENGQVFEHAIMSREKFNPAYKFLFNASSEDALYYRWKVYTFVHESAARSRKDLSSCRPSSYRMSVDGPILIPPEARTKQRQQQEQKQKDDGRMKTGQQLARAYREQQHVRDSLRQSEYEELRDLLQYLTSERRSIREAMGFAMDLSEFADEIVDAIADELTNAGTSIRRKIALFHLTSDILHNSNVAQYASAYRKKLEICLPYIVQSLRQAHAAIQGRMSARMMQEKVLAVLRAWESWSIFSPTFVLGLSATFEMKDDDDSVLDNDAAAAETPTHDIVFLRRKCKQAGMVSTGSLQELVARLQFVSRYITTIAKERNLSGAENAAEIETVAKLLRDSLREAGIQVEIEQDKEEETDPDGEVIEDSELDGEPMDGDDHDLDDLDGEPIDDSDVDGEPMD